MYATYLARRDPAIDLFLDMREEERLQEEGYTDSFTGDTDEEMDCWGNLWSSEALIDEMDRLTDLFDDIDPDFIM